MIIVEVKICIRKNNIFYAEKSYWIAVKAQHRKAASLYWYTHVSGK
jgi:hypothetical protein